ncbi:MAG: hypothetical protein HUK03_07925, partial [Bacteroidaceae bacterium]|nr:hypothetical protein [Bacteroidaceae bacterium]
ANYHLLRQAGWRVLVVWECQLRGKDQRAQTLWALTCKLSSLILDTYGCKRGGYDAEEGDALPMVAEDE